MSSPIAAASTAVSATATGNKLVRRSLPQTEFSFFVSTDQGSKAQDATGVYKYTKAGTSEFVTRNSDGEFVARDSHEKEFNPFERSFAASSSSAHVMRSPLSNKPV